MLLRFSVRNRASILDRQEVSFVSSSLKDDEQGLIEANAVPFGRVLPSVVVYGPNASGKTSLLDGLVQMRQLILNSHTDRRASGALPYRPFKLGGEEGRPTAFDIDFIVAGTRYHYGFEFVKSEIRSEWLFSFPSSRKVMLFERDGPKDIVFGRSLKGRNRVIADLMRANSLFFSAAIQNGHEELTRISKFFEEMSPFSLIEVGPTNGRRFEARSSAARSTINFLNRIGTGVVDYEFVKKELTPDEKEMKKRIMDAISAFVSPADIASYADDNAITEIRLKHAALGGRDCFFDLDEESAGTRRLLELMLEVFDALETGSLMIVDEIDASIHTQVCEAIVGLFSDPSANPHGAQLLATTHDTNLMLSKAFRRDQIWFCEKDRSGATHIFPLSDIKVRKGDNIEKGYLQGRFGAIPFSGSIEELCDKG